MTATEKEDGIAAMEVLRALGTRLTNEHGFLPDRETVLRVGTFIDTIGEYHAAQRNQNAGRRIKPERNQVHKDVCQTDQKECPFRSPGETTCHECRSLQRLYDEAHAIEDILIRHGLIERKEEHQYLQAACSVVDYQDTHIRIVFQDPIFQRLHILEWFSPLGYTWSIVIGLFFAPFLTEADWMEDN